MKIADTKLTVAVYLRGDALDPGLITRTIGVQPTRCQIKGDASITSTGRHVVAKIGLWSIAAQSHSSVLGDHLEELRGIFGIKPQCLAFLPTVQEAYLDVFVAELVDGSSSSESQFSLRADDLEFLSQLGVMARFTVSSILGSVSDS